jgi:hypothetical protein
VAPVKGATGTLGCGPWLMARAHGRKVVVLGLPGQRLMPVAPSVLDGPPSRRLRRPFSVRGGEWLSGSGGLAAAAFGVGSVVGRPLGGAPGCRSDGFGLATAPYSSWRAVAVSAGSRPWPCGRQGGGECWCSVRGFPPTLDARSRDISLTDR